MAAFPENGDETGERSSATPTESSLYETDRGRSLSEYRAGDDQTRRAVGSHPLIESGCVREFAVHVLGTAIDASDGESETEIHIDQLTPSDARRAVEIIQQLEEYEQTVALVEKHGGYRPTAAQYSLAAHVNTARTTWEIVAFYATYPKMEVVYPIFGRAVDRDTDPVAAIIDPGPNETGDLNTITAFEITTEQVVPTELSPNEPITELGNAYADGSSSSDLVGYQIAIDWFVS